MNVQESRAKIMVVDDSRGALQLLSRMLTNSGFDVRPVGDGQNAVDLAYRNPPDMALLDISMAGVNGYELCTVLKSNPVTQHIPVIFISALDDIRNKEKAFKVGAIDYIVKPYQFREVLIRIETHLETVRKMQTLVEMINSSANRYETNNSSNNLDFIAHDLRNPLHVITLNLSLLKKQLDPTTEKLDGYLERIDRNLVLVNQIINEAVTD